MENKIDSNLASPERANLLKKRKRDEYGTRQQNLQFFDDYAQEPPGSSNNYEETPGSSKKRVKRCLTNINSENSESYVQSHMYPS